MTKDLADELERLAKEATPGEWEINHGVIGGGGQDEDGDRELVADLGFFSAARGEQDAALIVALRNALPQIISALRREEWQGIETVVVEARDAVAFLDRVRAASSDEQIAVGQDHWNRAEAALRAVAALPTKGTDHE